MTAVDSWPDLARRLVALVIFVAMVGGFALSFGGTTSEDQTILTWLGYPEYNTPAFLVGMAGLAAGVAYGRVISRRGN